MIKILHCADLHLGTRFSGLPQEKAVGRRREQRRLLRAMLDLCISEKCDLVVLAGDIFDRPEADGDSVEALMAFARQVRLPVVITPGNHDYCSAASPYLTRQWPENVYIFQKPALEKISIPKLNLAIWGAGYTSMDCPDLLEGFRATGEEEVHIMVLHGDPVHSDVPCCPITRSEIRESGLDYLAMGHLHHSGGFMAGATFCAWPGCTMGRGYDETGCKGVILAEVEPGNVKSRLVSLTEGTYEDITLQVGENALEDILNALPADTEDSIYRITLEGESVEPSLWELQEELEPRFFHLELRDHRKAPSDPLQDYSRDSLEGAYFRLLRETMEEADPEDREILSLAMKISRSILEGREVELP